MATTNPITGDTIMSRVNSQQFIDNYDLIFGKKHDAPEKEPEPDTQEPIDSPE